MNKLYPLRKNNSIYIIDSRSSFLPYSFPLCAAIEAYRVVPRKVFPSLKGLSYLFFLNNKLHMSSTRISIKLADTKIN